MIREYIKSYDERPSYAKFIKYTQLRGMGCNPRSSCYFGNDITWNEILKLTIGEIKRSCCL